MFNAEILNRDFPSKVIELKPLGRIGGIDWNFDPEEPRYIAASVSGFFLFDKYSGKLFRLDEEGKKAIELVKVQEGEEKYIVGLEADEGDVLLYSQEKFYLGSAFEPAENIISAESATMSAGSIFTVNNPDYSAVDGRVFVELDTTGKVIKTFGEYVNLSDDRSKKTRPQIRAHGSKVVIWSEDLAKVRILDADSGESSEFSLNHLILEKRDLINSGEYFKDLKGRVTSMVMPVFVDLDFNEAGLFALMCNDGLGVIVQFSIMGEVEEIYTFPLMGSAIALDLAVLDSQELLEFGVITARGQKLSAYLYTVPATHK